MTLAALHDQLGQMLSHNETADMPVFAKIGGEKAEINTATMWLAEAKPGTFGFIELTHQPE